MFVFIYLCTFDFDSRPFFSYKLFYSCDDNCVFTFEKSIKILEMVQKITLTKGPYFHKIRQPVGRKQDTCFSLENKIQQFYS